MSRTRKIIKGALIFLITSLSDPFFTSFRDSSYALVVDKLEWLQVYWRTLQEGYQTGYVRGTPYRTTDGHWATRWRLGGQPFIHVVIPLVFWVLFVVPISFLIPTYLLPKYRLFRRLRGAVVHPKNFLKFRRCVSLYFIAVVLMISLVGFTGTKIDPNMIISAEPSSDCLGIGISLRVECSVTITRFAIITFCPFIFDENMERYWLYCRIEKPREASWRITEVDESTISLNGTAIPSYVEITQQGNATEFMLVRFDVISLLSFVERPTFQESSSVNLRVEGRLKSGEFFAGSSQVLIACSQPYAV